MRQERRPRLLTRILEVLRETPSVTPAVPLMGAQWALTQFPTRLTNSLKPPPRQEHIPVVQIGRPAVVR